MAANTIWTNRNPGPSVDGVEGRVHLTLYRVSYRFRLDYIIFGLKHIYMLHSSRFSFECCSTTSIYFHFFNYLWLTTRFLIFYKCLCVCVHLFWNLHFNISKTSISCVVCSRNIISNLTSISIIKSTRRQQYFCISITFYSRLNLCATEF